MYDPKNRAELFGEFKGQKTFLTRIELMEQKWLSKCKDSEALQEYKQRIEVDADANQRNNISTAVLQARSRKQKVDSSKADQLKAQQPPLKAAEDIPNFVTKT